MICSSAPVFGGERRLLKPRLNATCGYFEATCKHACRYIVLTCMGPCVPYQVVLDVLDEKYQFVLEDLGSLKAKLEPFILPESRYYTIAAQDGSRLNVKETRPPLMRTNEKLPVLIRVYGGPGSQTVSSAFRLDWSTVLASHLRVLVLQVDGRGTGYQGYGFMTKVFHSLGLYEAQDVHSLIEHLGRLPYVDTDRIGIQGWSYGGYLSLKVLESDTLGRLTLCLAIAPVTSWLLYDSIYTERYMGLPSLNEVGYRSSKVNLTSHKWSPKTMLWLYHGTADDNVHYQHSLVLMEELIQNGQDRQFFHLPFPDADHSLGSPAHIAYLWTHMTHQLASHWNISYRV